MKSTINIYQIFLKIEIDLYYKNPSNNCIWIIIEIQLGTEIVFENLIKKIKDKKAKSKVKESNNSEE